MQEAERTYSMTAKVVQHGKRLKLLFTALRSSGWHLLEEFENSAYIPALFDMILACLNVSAGTIMTMVSHGYKKIPASMALTGVPDQVSLK